MLSNNLILGSQSPRRQELLQQAGYKFDVRSIDFDESYPEDLPAGDVAEYIAKGKNDAYRSQFPTDTIITADTVVISNQTILGKPQNKEEAIKMLSLLSGTTHSVITGVTISSPEKHQSVSSHTEVKVRLLSIKEIEYYIDHFSPFDKAGAYGIQEWFGLTMIKKVNGSYYNVVGLPVDKVYKLLTEEFNIYPGKMISPR